MGGFSVIEGDVVATSNIKKIDASLSTDTTAVSPENFTDAFNLTSIYCYSDVPVDFTMDIFTEAGLARESHILSLQVSATEDGGEVSLNPLKIPGVSSTSKLYVRVTQASGVSRTFRVIVYGERAQLI